MVDPALRNTRTIKKRLRRLRSGIDGTNGQNASDSMVEAAIDEWMTVHHSEFVGPSGTQGIQGIQGPPGNNGTSGINGTNGVNTTSNVLVGTITLTETAVVAIAAGVRKLTVSLAGTVTTGNYLVFPASATPTGYALHDAICQTNGQITVSLTAPFLAVLASYSIPCRVVRIMT